MKKYRKSLYDISKQLGTQRLNDGFDYTQENFILQKTLSPYLFRNDELGGFLNKLNEVVIQNIESIKRIRIHNNYTVDKNTKYIN